MINNIKNKYQKRIKAWTRKNYLNLAIFNTILIGLFLLRSAGYFDPFFLVSVNMIVLIALISSIFLLGARSKILFLIALIFWLFAGFLKLVKIDVWTERTGVYAFEAFVVGAITFLFESIKCKTTNS